MLTTPSMPGAVLHDLAPSRAAAVTVGAAIGGKGQTALTLISQRT